jgi:hypothetical protein
MGTYFFCAHIHAHMLIFARLLSTTLEPSPTAEEPVLKFSGQRS